MPRPSRAAERRGRLLPSIAATFAELGYRRTTTAELAARCGVQENVLYRLWPDKKEMFVAAVEFVFDNSIRIWRGILQPGTRAASGAERLLKYESRHHGEFGLYRILFAGLSETDDPDIRAAMKRLYEHFAAFCAEQIASHRGGSRRKPALDPVLAAWGIVGLGTVANIANELGLMPARKREELIRRAGMLLLEGGS